MRLLLLKEGTAADLAQLPQNLAEEVRQADAAVTTYELKLDYSYWPADQILKVTKRDEQQHLQGLLDCCLHPKKYLRWETLW